MYFYIIQLFVIGTQLISLLQMGQSQSAEFLRLQIDFIEAFRSQEEERIAWERNAPRRARRANSLRNRNFAFSELDHIDDKMFRKMSRMDRKSFFRL